MTLEELCFLVKARPQELETWAAAGALGAGMKESTEGKWRHVSKHVMRRAVFTRVLLDAGMTLDGAAKLSTQNASIDVPTRPEEKAKLNVGDVSVPMDQSYLKIFSS